jgi:hypothetical protein
LSNPFPKRKAYRNSIAFNNEQVGDKTTSTEEGKNLCVSKVLSNIPLLQPVVTVPKTTCDEVTEESTTTDSPGAAGEEERDGQVEGLNMGTFLTVDEVGRVEEDGEKRTAQNGKKHTVYHCYACLAKARHCK